MDNENERPCIEFDGRRYRRHLGAWYDQLTHMKANVHLSQRIDARAKEDTALWKQCRHQDFSDNPKNRGRVLMELSDIFDVDPVDDSQPTVPHPRPAATHTRRSRVGENVKVGFRNRSRELVVRCDIEPGWHETASGWVFQESDKVELPSGHPLRVSAKFVEHAFGQWHRRSTYDGATAVTAPDHQGPLDALHPTFTQSEREISQNIRLKVEGSTCNFIINWLDTDDELNGALPWKRVGRDWVFKDYFSGLYEQPIRLNGERLAVARPFYIEIEVVLHEPRQTNPAPEYAERTPFASGGLPSLGKRR
jgi:hypothetical protein